MLIAILLLLPLAVIGLSSEYLWRKKILRGEGGRKFVHILSGVWIAFWPYFVSYETIQVLALVLVIILFLSRFVGIFHAVHDVKRPTAGELFYPLTILACALLGPEEWIFAVAMLYLAIPDGLAAIVGTRYVKPKRFYKIFGQPKSLLGSSAYFVSALVGSLVAFYLFSPDAGNLFFEYSLALLLIAVATTALENLLPYGVDNLLIPVFVVLVLR